MRVSDCHGTIQLALHIGADKNKDKRKRNLRFILSLLVEIILSKKCTRLRIRVIS